MTHQQRGSQLINRDNSIREAIARHRKILKDAATFTCFCCGQDKPSGDAEGVHIYKTGDPLLQGAMQTPEGPRVGTYVICIACVDSLSEDAIYEKVTANFAKVGFFGRTKAVRSNTRNLAQPDHSQVGIRTNPKVSISVTYEAIGHDNAAYERLLEHLRDLARFLGSSQKEQ